MDKILPFIITVFMGIYFHSYLVAGEVSTSSTMNLKPETVTPETYYPTASPPLEDSVPLSSSWRNLDIKSPSGEVMKKVLSKGCTHRYTLTCLKLDVVSLVDRLSEADKYQLMPGVTVIKDGADETSASRKFPGDLVATLAKDYPNDVDARLDAYLLRRLGQYLNSHSVTFKLFDEESFSKAFKMEQEAVEQVDNKETGVHGTLLPIAFGALAMLAGKALMTGLLSLMLSAIIGLKSLTSGGGKQAVTYEIVQKPVYSHSHSHSHELHHEHGLGGHGGGGGGGGYGHSSYGRSFSETPGVDIQDQETPEGIRQRLQTGAPVADAQHMAYSSYVPQGNNQRPQATNSIRTS
ncbi:hypothetical protein C0J52_16936 [Blattella germanica]|nr:hypothetical protein C0J52_16936 [Blattella germanica]